jgi:signal transduction histidine kinase
VRWWRRLNLRARLILIGAGGLAVGFALGGAGLVAALGYALQRTVDTEAMSTARDVAALVDAGELPQPVPVAGATLVQVVDTQNRVRSASIGADRLVGLLRPDETAATRGGERLVLPGDRAGVNGPLRVVAVPAGPADDPQTVVVALPFGETLRSVRLLRTTLLVAYPLLVGGVAVVAWRVVGATLRPVEALRAGAETITGAGGAGRLPVPDGADEIHRLAVTLNGMLDRLEAARARQRAFVADAAHELRSPLANLRVQLEVAQLLDEPVATEDLLADTGRLIRLVDDLLLLARADDAPPQAARHAPVELVGLVRELAQSYAGARVPVEVKILDAPLWLDGDPDALRRALANLIDNAVRHATGHVTVEAAAGPVLAVTDDGSGIPPADRDRVFSRFTRLDEGRARDAGGAGLGLPIARELARQHGGTILLTDANPGLRAEIRFAR